MEKENKNGSINAENTETQKDKSGNAPLCCAGCVRWEKFGKTCFYYWEGKKHCTMWTADWDEAAIQ